jgi:hypothetical protein
MLRMEFPEHGRDASAGDGLMATGAKRATFQVIMGLAIGLPLVVEK